MMAIYVTMVYIGTGDKKISYRGIIVLLAAFITGYFMFDVIRLRVGAWINPWVDPEGRSYQIIQALISQAAGGIFGTGPGMGSPNLGSSRCIRFYFLSDRRRKRFIWDRRCSSPLPNCCHFVVFLSEIGSKIGLCPYWHLEFHFGLRFKHY